MHLMNTSENGNFCQLAFFFKKARDIPKKEISLNPIYHAGERAQKQQRKKKIEEAMSIK